MARIIKEITVDVAKKNLFQAIVAKQYDINSRFLKVTFVNEGEVINIDTSSVVMINARRADEVSKPFAGVTNSDGTVTVPLTDWMLELDDRVTCDISVVDADGNKLTSTSFELEVETASHNGEMIEDDKNYDLLVALLAEVSNMKKTLVFTDRTIADIDLSENISVEQLQNALKAYPFKIFTSAPTTSDVGKIGQFGGRIYYSTTSNTYKVDLYLCCSAGNTEGTYRWAYINSSTISDSQIASALSEYLEKHPIEGVGSDGITPHIGANGNWFIGDEDTGVKANGEDGQDGKTPVLGVDYFTESDKEFIVSSVIDYFGGRPLYGFVDENNRIVVSGNLGNGTYTVKYELEDGTTVDIGELTLGGTSEPDEPEVPEVNNYFNKDTAQLNFRLGSNGTPSAYDGMVTTDFIEYTDDMTGKRFYASGIEPVMSSQYNYNARVVYYDSNKTKVAEFNDSYSNIFDEDVGVLTTYGAFTGDGYIRISLVVKDNASVTSADVADLSITLK